MDNARRLLHWNATFVLTGKCVVCTGCMIAQPLDDAEVAFLHSPGCKNDDDHARHPWMELHDILDAVRG